MTTLQVEAHSRWDALELMDALLPFHPYLVQKTQAAWEVHASADADPDELEDELCERLREAMRRRDVRQAAVCFDDGTELVVYLER